MQQAHDTEDKRSHRSIGRTLLAGLVLFVAAWLLLHFVLSIVSFLATVIVFVAAVLALIWALRVLL